jgi:hypothetical protein
MASLTIVVDGAEQRHPLEAASVTLGRGLESDIRLKDIKASRRHCQVVKTPKGYQCVDLSSGNGTYVNGIQIKQQMLASGDRITIGSTTIAFEDAAPAGKPFDAAQGKAAPARPAASPKAATAKVPVVAAARPPDPGVSSTRTATARISAENVPVAPTRKITARVEAVKAPSQGALKPASQPAAKTGSRVSKSGRGTGPRPVRPPADAPKKKSPVLIIAIAVGVLLLGGGAFFFFSSHDNGDQAKVQIDQLVKKAEKAEKAEHYDEAIQEYKKALDLCQGDRWKVRASDITKLLQQLESRRPAGTTAPPKPDPKESPEKGPDVQAKKTEIAEKHKLGGDPSAADWGGALKDWNDFLKGKLPADTKAKAEGEIRSLQGKAKDDADRLRKKADGLAQENKMAEAVDLLRHQLVRFEHSDLKELHAELEATLKKYDK